jgi:ligand-binding SRPBCC domain-containing protein
VLVQRICIDTYIDAPARQCFDAARDIDLHVVSLAHTRERAVAGRTSGLIELGEEVTWRGRHFGVHQHFTSKITAFDSPFHFQDTMQRGAFKSFVHDHYFIGEATGTTMRDILIFAAPFGIVGQVVENLILGRYLRGLLSARAAVIKAAAETRTTCRTA